MAWHVGGEGAFRFFLWTIKTRRERRDTPYRHTHTDPRSHKTKYPTHTQYTQVFGFDVLVPAATASAADTAADRTAANADGAAQGRGPEQEQWLVVDVNYFPSFKEVCEYIYIHIYIFKMCVFMCRTLSCLTVTRLRAGGQTKLTGLHRKHTAHVCTRILYTHPDLNMYLKINIITIK